MSTHNEAPSASGKLCGSSYLGRNIFLLHYCFDFQTCWPRVVLEEVWLLNQKWNLATIKAKDHTEAKKILAWLALSDHFLNVNTATFFAIASILSEINVETKLWMKKSLQNTSSLSDPNGRFTFQSVKRPVVWFAYIYLRHAIVSKKSQAGLPFTKVYWWGAF